MCVTYVFFCHVLLLSYVLLMCAYWFCPLYLSAYSGKIARAMMYILLSIALVSCLVQCKKLVKKIFITEWHFRKMPLFLSISEYLIQMQPNLFNSEQHIHSKHLCVGVCVCVCVCVCVFFCLFSFVFSIGWAFWNPRETEKYKKASRYFQQTSLALWIFIKAIST